MRQNVWPNIQMILIDGAEGFGGAPGDALARQMSTAFLDNVYAAWEETGKMYEKFSAVEVGVPGAGGEYKAAWGFGWTNGAVLDLLERFGVM